MPGRTGYTLPLDEFDPLKHFGEVYEHFDEKLGESVATASALPAANNWVGRTIYVEDLELLVVWNGSGWKRPATGEFSEAAGVLTMAANWTLNNSQASWAGGVASIRLNVTRTISAVASHATHGNIGNVLIATITDAKLRPKHTHALNIDNTGPITTFYVQPDGGIWLSAMLPGLAWDIGESRSFSGTYVRNL